MRGRKPTPTALRVLRGQKRSNPNEPTPTKAIPAPPAELSGEALQEWRRLATELFTNGLLTNLDRDALAGFCVALVRWRHAEAQLAKTGEVVRSPTGYPILSPWLSVSKAALKQMQQLGAEFGWSPSSRSRINVKPHQPDKFDQLWQQRHKA
jgi:P27 family predicted phage terminase small subunit